MVGSWKIGVRDSKANNRGESEQRGGSPDLTIFRN
jgi:hypothetical protein